MADTSFDIIIIGGGPGGYVAAIRAAQLGFKTAVVEREHLGGICLNWGCIPTKALLRSAEIYHYMKHAKDYGLSAENDRLRRGRRGAAFARRVGPSQWRRHHAPEEEQGHGDLGRGEDHQARRGRGLEAVEARHAAAESGAQGRSGRRGPTRPSTSSSPPVRRPRVLPGLEPDGKLVWTYFEAMVPKAMPKSLLVVGSGAIGIEFASFYNAMGVDVTVVEIMDQIMPVEDAEISKIAQKQLEKQGLKIRTGAKVTQLKKGKPTASPRPSRRAARAKTITVDRVISAVGVQGNIEGLGLEALGRQDREGLRRHRRLSAAPMCPASMPSATLQARPCWPTRPSMRASSASRRSRASTPIR